MPDPLSPIQRTVMLRRIDPELGMARFYSLMIEPISSGPSHRRQVQALTELDEHTLRDVGLLRTDVYAALSEPFHRDPSQVLKALCCHWRSFGHRFQSTVEPVPCC